MKHTPTHRRTLSGRLVPITKERPSFGGLVAALTDLVKARRAERDDLAHERGPEQLVVPAGDGNRYGRRATKRARAQKWEKARRAQAREARRDVMAQWNDPQARKAMNEAALDLYRAFLKQGMTPKQASRAVKRAVAGA